MIQNGMMFGGEGPMMQGTWFNPHTGDSFTVRDSFFEDNQYVVTTTDGRYFKYEQLQNYIQGDPKHMKEIKENLKQTEQLPDEVSSLIQNDNYSDMIIQDDIDLLSKKPKSLGNLNDTQYNHMKSTNDFSQSQVMSFESEDEMLVRRILKKATTPIVKCSITWNNFPEKQLEMLEMMGVDNDIIINYFLQQIDLNYIKEVVREKIEERLFPEVKTIDEKIEEPIVEKQKTKKQPKTSKK